MAGGEIIVVPMHAKGHIFPAIELCRHLADRGYRITLLLPSVASAGPLHPLIRILECPPAPRPPEAACPPPGPGFDFEAGYISPFRELLARGADDLVCAVVDVMMSHLITVCRELGIPAVSFFTSSACSAALDRAASNLSSSDDDEVLGPGRTLPLTIPGIPEDMALTISDLKHRGGPGPPPPGFGPGQHGGGPPPRPPPFGIGPAPPPFRPGTFGPPFRPEHSSAAPPTEPGPFRDGAPPPEGLAQTDGAIALLFNTCDDLERPFIDYVAKEAGKPVWGVGPLLPASFWSRSLVRDEVARGPTDRESSVSEKEVVEWLDSKPRGSVIYVSFGSLMGPSDAELAELAAGLEESGRPFIWALQPGATMPHDPAGRPTSAAGPAYFPIELPHRVAEGEEGMGLLIRGWAPQLLVLSHPSTGGFLTHCGWNSTVEAIGCGVPMLTWPIHGDQMHNAKLVTRRLKVGHHIRADDGDGDGGVRKDDVVLGIERLMSDTETQERAASMRSTFVDRFPETSSASLDAFLQFLNKSSR